jgi:hypothetical protein
VIGIALYCQPPDSQVLLIYVLILFATVNVTQAEHDDDHVVFGMSLIATLNLFVNLGQYQTISHAVTEGDAVTRCYTM